ncbi:MAG: hypothetical protein HOG49_21500 [Candidatus Scalindua sp.]|jgi:hypothetical protein|nr:hypothetical protein [Candidatus Scalindua sp.]
MYQDSSGKTATKGLVGVSGTTYGNTKLFSQSEKDLMLADGITVFVKPAIDPPSFEANKQTKEVQIKAEYDREKYTPVQTDFVTGTEPASIEGDPDVDVVTTYTWNGGHESSMALYSAVRLADQKGEVTVDLWDINNVKQNFLISEARIIVQSIADCFLVIYDKKQRLMVDIGAAEDQDQLNLIVW